MSELFCKKQTECSSCIDYKQDIVHYFFYTKGEDVMPINCESNTIFFLISGVMEIKSEELRNKTITDGEFFLQAALSKIGFKILENSELLVYTFDVCPQICTKYFDQYITQAQQEVSSPKIMEMKFPLRLFIQDLKICLENHLFCINFLRAKQMEFYYLLNHYYSSQEIIEFYSPIFKSDKKFRYFILNNYNKVKDVEEFATLGHYPVSTFRKLFKETFGIPAYKWMIKRKGEDIHHDLLTSNMKIIDVAKKYGFDSISNFSHFCKTNFKLSPRDIRKNEIL